MTILQPGTFKTSDYRKPIPNKVKLAVVARDFDVDHRPPLNARPYDTEAGDFIPPQHAPEFLEVVKHAEHDARTFGRKEGAERTVTTRGSDVGEAKRIRKARDTTAIHQAALASKAGNYRGAADILSSVKKKSRLRSKAKIQSSGFQKGRKFQSRNAQRSAP